MKFLRSIYLYIVSFVALMITITAVISSFNAISDIIIPESEVYSYGYTEPYVQTDIYPHPTNPEQTEKAIEEAKQLEEERIEKQKQSEIRRSQKSLINSIAAILVGGVTYWFHWSKIEKDHKILNKLKKETTEN